VGAAPAAPCARAAAHRMQDGTPAVTSRVTCVWGVAGVTSICYAQAAPKHCNATFSNRQHQHRAAAGDAARALSREGRQTAARRASTTAALWPDGSEPAAGGPRSVSRCRRFYGIKRRCARWVPQAPQPAAKMKLARVLDSLREHKALRQTSALFVKNGGWRLRAGVAVWAAGAAAVQRRGVDELRGAWRRLRSGQAANGPARVSCMSSSNACGSMCPGSGQLCSRRAILQQFLLRQLHHSTARGRRPRSGGVHAQDAAACGLQGSWHMRPSAARGRHNSSWATPILHTRTRASP
jgi:hypothetical protein